MLCPSSPLHLTSRIHSSILKFVFSLLSLSRSAPDLFHVLVWSSLPSGSVLFDVLDDLPFIVCLQFAHTQQLIAQFIRPYLVNQEVIPIPIVPHACPFTITTPGSCCYRQVWFRPFWHLVLLRIVPVFFNKGFRLWVRVYLFIIIQTQVLVAIIFLSGALFVHLAGWFHQ